MLKEVDDEIVFTSGRRIYVSRNIVGIDPSLELFHGYDGGIDWPPPDYMSLSSRLTVPDMHELADLMIERWKALKATLGDAK